MLKLDKRLDFAKKFFGDNIDAKVLVVINKYQLITEAKREIIRNSVEAELKQRGIPFIHWDNKEPLEG